MIALSSCGGRAGLVLGVGRAARRLWRSGVLDGVLSEVLHKMLLHCMEFFEGGEAV